MLCNYSKPKRGKFPVLTKYISVITLNVNKPKHIMDRHIFPCFLNELEYNCRPLPPPPATMYRNHGKTFKKNG